MPRSLVSIVADLLRARSFVLLGLLIVGAPHGVAQEPPAAVLTARGLQYPRLFPGIAQVGGKVYILGGHTSVDGWRPQSAFEVFDLATQTVAQLPDMPVARACFGCVVVGTKIILIGGATIAHGEGSVQEYDTVSGQWTSRASLTMPRVGLRAAIVGNRIFAFGGFKEHYREFEVYDIAADVWTRLPDMPRGALNPCQLVYDGHILVIGGGTADGSKAVDRVQSYDPETGSWTDLPALPTPKGDHVVGVVGNELVVLGGWNEVFLNTVEAFDFTKRTWRSLPPLSTDRGYHGAVIHDGGFLLFGGVNGDPGAAQSYVLPVDTYALPANRSAMH